MKRFRLTHGGQGTVNVYAWPLGRKRFIQSAIKSHAGWTTYDASRNIRSFQSLRATVRFILSTIKEG